MNKTEKKTGKKRRVEKERVLKAVSCQYLFGLSVCIQAAVFWLSTKVGFFPGAETVASVAGTCAEIIAGLYGVTLAGYTFFLSRMDALVATDGTLHEIGGNVKKRFKYLIWFISFHVLVTLAVAVTLMYLPAPSGDGQIAYFYRLFCNEFMMSMAASCGLILYYSLMVIDPNCFEREAEKMRRKLCPEDEAQGSAAEFIRLYDRIETVCGGMVPHGVLRQIRENKGSRFDYTIKLLRETRPDLKDSLTELALIHSCYCCLLNGKTFAVSEGMCQRARILLDALENPAPVEEPASEETITQ